MRLDFDNHSATKIRSSYNYSSLLFNINAEINKLPANIFSIESIPGVLRTKKRTDNDDEYLSKTGITLRCKLLEKSYPLMPALRLHITKFYPDQPPDVLSLTNTTPPRLEFTGKKSFKHFKMKKS